MKRILTFALALVMVFSLAACGSKSDDNKKNDNEVTMTARGSGSAQEVPWRQLRQRYRRNRGSHEWLFRSGHEQDRELGGGEPILIPA